MSGNVTSAITAAMAIGAGGFCGAIARWATSVAAATVMGTHLPWGTFAANLLGCFVMGLLVALFERAGDVPPAATLAVLTGFLGAYTTFSTFGLDTVALARTGGLRAAGLYVTASVVGGIALCAIGVRLGGGLR